MTYEFSVLQSFPDHEDATVAHVFRVAGTADGEPFCVEIFAEHDARDLDYEPLWGKDVQDCDFFFDELCQWQPFIDAHNADYKRYSEISQY